jgi:L-alanine-DL-glutamate epimerase-like enolase superfamily enzyme
MHATVEPRTLRFRTPLRTAFGELHERELLELRLDVGDGLVGRGEAAPLEPYDGVPLRIVREALLAYLPGPAAHRRARRAGRARRVPGRRRPAPGARGGRHRAVGPRRPARGPAGVRAADGRPVVGGAGQRTIGATDRAGAAAAAHEAARAGFSCVKVKVGSGDDAGRVAAVRAAAGPGVALRVDANGAWTVEEAIAAIEALAPAGVELIEEPVHGLTGLAQVRRAVAVRVAMDETAAEPGAWPRGPPTPVA